MKLNLKSPNTVASLFVFINLIQLFVTDDHRTRSSVAIRRSTKIGFLYVHNYDFTEKCLIQNLWKLLFPIKQESKNLNPLITFQNIEFQKFYRK